MPIIARNKKPLLISRKIEIRRVEIILPWTLRSTFWLLTTRFYTTNVCKRYIYAHVAFSKERTKPTIIYSVAVNLAADSLPTLVSTRAKSAKQTRIQGDRLFSRCSFFFSLSLSLSTLFPFPHSVSLSFLLSPYRPIKPSFACCLRSYTLLLPFPLPLRSVKSK